MGSKVLLKILVIIVIGITTVLSGCTESANAAKTPEEVVDKYVTAWSQMDTDAIIDLYSRNGPLKSKEYATFLGGDAYSAGYTKISYYEITSRSIKEDSGYITFDVVFKNDAGEIKNGKMSLTLIKESDGWKIWNI